MRSFTFLLVASAALVTASPIPVQSGYTRSATTLTGGYEEPPVPATTACTAPEGCAPSFDPSVFETPDGSLARDKPGRREWGRREFEPLEGESLARGKPGRREFEPLDEESLARGKPGRREYETLDGESLARNKPGRREFETPAEAAVA